MKAYGLIAVYASAAELQRVVRDLRNAGFTRLDTASPVALEEHEEGERAVPRAALAGALVGIATAIGMQEFASVISAPLNIGGRPLDSWPAFIPLTFILMVLFAALSLAGVFLFKLRLPWLAHPVFHSQLDLSREQFAVIIGASDPLYAGVRARLAPSALWVEELPWE